MSLLTIIQDSADRLGIVQPTSVIGSSDQQARQLLGIAQNEGKTLARRSAWQRITKEQTFTGVAADVQTSAIPDDFDRFVPETFWNRTQNRFVQGPLSVQAWQNIKGKNVPPVADAFRQRGDDILITPTASTSDTYAFEYVSKNWCTTADGATEQSQWTADDDLPLLDAEIMTLGIEWRFKKAKGFDYSEEFRDYETQAVQAMARDGGARTLNMGSDVDLSQPFTPTVPDGSWPL